MLHLSGIPSRGARRRLQALCARGWSIAELGRRLGCSRSTVSDLLRTRAHLFPATDAAIRDLYDTLWNQPAPTDGAGSDTRTRNRARRLGWVPPLAWDDIDTDHAPPTSVRDQFFVDEIAITLTLQGERVHLTVKEREVAVEQLTRAGRSCDYIAQVLCIPHRSVTRIRSRLGLPRVLDAAGERIAS